MKRWLAALGLALSVAAPAAAHADAITDHLLECARIHNQQGRLACYDGVAAMLKFAPAIRDIAPQQTGGLTETPANPPSQHGGLTEVPANPPPHHGGLTEIPANPPPQPGGLTEMPANPPPQPGGLTEVPDNPPSPRPSVAVTPRPAPTFVAPTGAAPPLPATAPPIPLPSTPLVTPLGAGPPSQ